ncbi:MAG: TIGR04282 family arsenosugar biosynthesis glycosyltransferase [Halioglobus sp.]|nr:TIGR04282 family arsenosugar biosynthesis glycosyltransferase [Halioglobus sp.]
MGAERRRTLRGEVLLIQFSRTPRPGQVKTRMLPHLTAAQACELHCDLTRWTCRQLLASELGAVELSVAGVRQHPLFTECQSMGVDRVLRQRGADLGQRMYNAIRCGLARYRAVILVGSDCPEIDAGYLSRAVAALRTATVVLGPAADGGYVLIGATAIRPDIFEGVTWGSGEVYRQTTAALSRAGMRWAALPVLRDIDRPEDLPVWEAIRSGA